MTAPAPVWTRPTAWVWALLMLATVITTWGLSKDAFPAREATVAILLIAAIKVRAVLMHFMDLRHAPRPLRLIFQAWVVAVTAMLIGLYLRAGPGA